MTTVYLVRHSEKMKAPTNMWEVFDRIQPLSVRGEKKAKALLDMEELRHADMVCTSPFARTLSTLRYIAEADGLSITMDERLRELEFGGEPFAGGPPPAAGTGLPPDHKVNFMARQWVERDLADGDGESVNQCCARMTAAISEILRDHEGKTVLVGSHGASICAYLSGLIDGVDDDFVRSVTQPAVFRLVFDGQNMVQYDRLPLPEGAR